MEGSREVDLHVDDSLRLLVANLSKHMGRSEFKEFITKIGLEKFKSVQKVKYSNVGYLSFENLEDRATARDFLHNKNVDGRKLTVEDVKPRNFGGKGGKGGKRKRGGNEDDDEEDGDGKKMRDDNDEEERTTAKTAKDTVAPLWQISYEEQVAKKNETMRSSLIRMTRKIRKTMVKQARSVQGIVKTVGNKEPPICINWQKSGTCNFGDACRYRHPVSKEEGDKDGEDDDDGEDDGNRQVELPNWLNPSYVKEHVELVPSLGFQYCDIKPSPLIDGYRNKCEFTIGYNSSGKLTAGFRVGSYVEGSTAVEGPFDCPNVSAVAKLSCEVFESFINTSLLPPYDIAKHIGCWRTLTVRNSTYTKELLWLLLVSLKDIEEEVWEKELNRLIEFLKAKASILPLTSFSIQVYDGPSSPNQYDLIKNVMGKDAITEKLLSKSFRISPDAFFQVNTVGAEMLYSQVKECVTAPGLLAKPEDSVLLDVCCGTGTIGLCLADSVKKVVGIELSEAAVKDARFNAELNNCPNALFIASRAETVISSMLKVEKKVGVDDVTDVNEWSLPVGIPCIAVVDPPRAGLHKDVIKAIRCCSLIKRVVYVSCNPTGESFLQNILLFVKESDKKIKGPAFHPTKAIPVDMFPYTNHCELVYVLERD